MRFARSKTSVSVSVSQSELEKKEIEMVRGPCCDKMGLKRGPWTPEEDHVLVSYIQRFGHGNWRALPQHAGLMRCGKSCRLRWTNYLRPDIKRGNFSEEEEDTIIKLHEMLGNRWSAIAARIPGRTDNEIKNVWHTRLKKKLKQNQTDTADTRKPRKPTTTETSDPQTHTETDFKPNPKSKIKTEPVYALMSPQQSCSSTEMSTGTESGLTTEKVVDIKEEEFIIDSWDTLPQADESLWSQFMHVDNFETLDDFSSANTTSLLQFPLPSSTSPNLNDLDFWHDIFMKAGEISELPEF